LAGGSVCAAGAAADGRQRAEHEGTEDVVAFAAGEEDAGEGEGDDAEQGDDLEPGLVGDRADVEGQDGVDVDALECAVRLHGA
jgi:hypothetical protein